MRYVNGTLTEIRLISGDIRDARHHFVVLGRDETLRHHYQQLTGRPFSKLTGWMQAFPVQASLADNRGLSILATSFRPAGSRRHQSRQVRDLQSAVEVPLAHMLSTCNATEVAMVPLSCRAPAVVATAMIQMIWDISVAAFLDAPCPLKAAKPTIFTIYSNTGVTPFADVLEHGHYPSTTNGWLFNTEIQFNRAKRSRYLARRKFRYRRVPGS